MQTWARLLVVAMLGTATLALGAPMAVASEDDVGSGCGDVDYSFDDPGAPTGPYYLFWPSPVPSAGVVFVAVDENATGKEIQFWAEVEFDTTACVPS